MKTLQLILKNKWNLHYGIGSYIMAILLLIFTMKDPAKYSNGFLYDILVPFYRLGETLGIWGAYLILTTGTAMLYYGFEIYQSSKIPEDSKPSDESMRDDVIAGVSGGTGYIISDLLGINIIYLITVAVLCIGLELYKRKQKVKIKY